MIRFPPLLKVYAVLIRMRFFTIWRACLPPGKMSSLLPAVLPYAPPEDVGNADLEALVIAMAAAQAVQFIGMPEFLPMWKR
jgi:hypothetical protein